MQHPTHTMAVSIFSSYDGDLSLSERSMVRQFVPNLALERTRSSGRSVPPLRLVSGRCQVGDAHRTMEAVGEGRSPK